MERGVDALCVWIDGRLQVAQISADQFGELAVLDDQAGHERSRVVLVFLRRKLFQDLYVGRPPGLGLFARSQTQFIEENFRKLASGVQVEFAAGGLVNLLL